MRSPPSVNIGTSVLYDLHKDASGSNERESLGAEKSEVSSWDCNEKILVYLMTVLNHKLLNCV